MGSVWTISVNTFREVLYRRIIYILLFLAFLFIIQTVFGLVYMDMAADAGEIDMLAQMRGQIILSLFGMMEFWSLVLAVFLGAVAVSSEIKNRTILSVLSRPVERWQFFLAKWLGTLGFLVVFLGAGAIVGVALSHHWQLDPSPLFALGVAELFVRLAVFSGVSIGLSSLVNPVVAGGGAVLVIFLGELSSMLREHPIRVLRYLGEGGYFLSPAGMPENLLESGLTKGVIEPSYGLYGAVIAENMLYALAVVVAGALLFSRRELIVK